MKNKMTKVAISAVIIIALLLGINQFGGSIDGTTVAWANIAQRVLKSKAFIYHATVTTTDIVMAEDQATDVLEIEMNMIFSEEYGTKIEVVTTVNEKNSIVLTYVLPAENRAVTIMPDLKQYMTVEFSDDLAKNAQKDWEKNDPRNMFQQIMDCEHIELGRKSIDGIEVEGLETTDPKYSGGMFEDIVARIWVDVETGWPILMEMDGVMDSPIGEGLIEVNAIMDSFEWDVDVDPAEFVPDIPEDYSEFANYEMPKMDAEAAIEGLKKFAELTGHYPEKLNLMSMIKEFQKVKSEKEKQSKGPSKSKLILASIKELNQKLILPEGTPENMSQKELEELRERRAKARDHGKKIMEEITKLNNELTAEWDAEREKFENRDMSFDMNEMMKEMMPIQSLGMFYMQLIQKDKDPHYYGDRVEPGDGEQILMVWKGDEGNYEVIYGDLTSAVLSPDQLPQLDDMSQEL